VLTARLSGVISGSAPRRCGRLRKAAMPPLRSNPADQLKDGCSHFEVKDRAYGFVGSFRWAWIQSLSPFSSPDECGPDPATARLPALQPGHRSGPADRALPIAVRVLPCVPHKPGRRVAGRSPAGETKRRGRPTPNGAAAAFRQANCRGAASRCRRQPTVVNRSGSSM
jgi:hypothetical protein